MQKKLLTFFFKNLNSIGLIFLIILTIIVAAYSNQKGNLSNNSRIEFSKRASGQPPSKLGIKQGQSISLREAMLALVTKSANDVATAVAEEIAGTEINFAKRMTKKAKSLGMNNTRFMNASGLYNKYQKSTALDMARLGIAIKRDFPLRYKIPFEDFKEVKPVVLIRKALLPLWYMFKSALPAAFPN